MPKHFRRPSPALAVSLAALFVALGGTSYAALTVTGKTIKNGSVTGRDLKDRSLGTKELSKRAVSSLKGNTGAKGAPGASGAPGVPGANGTNGTNGAPGAAGATKVVVRTVEQQNVSNNSAAIVDATCNPGERATGGGFRTLSADDFVPYSNRPNPAGNGNTPTGWHVEAINRTGVSTADMEAFVICASP